MKDIVITGRRILREVLIFCGCFAAAVAVNAYSIVHFKTEWKELFTTLPITLAVAGVFFGVLAVLRGVVFCGRLVLRRRAG
jgi:hypothetical protein